MLLASLRGHPVLLDFFATWCEPCRVGLPRTEALVAAAAKKGLVGWAISLDDDPAPVAPFVAKLGLTLPVRWDRGGKTADALGISLAGAAPARTPPCAVRYPVSPDNRANAERAPERGARGAAPVARASGFVATGARTEREGGASAKVGCRRSGIG